MEKTFYQLENINCIRNTKVPWIKIRSGGDDGHLYVSHELLVFNPYQIHQTIYYNKNDNLIKYYRTPNQEEITYKKHWKFFKKFNFPITNDYSEIYEVLDLMQGKPVYGYDIDPIHFDQLDNISIYWFKQISKKIDKIIYSFTNIPELNKKFKEKYKEYIYKNDDHILYSYYEHNIKEDLTEDINGNPKFINTQVIIKDINTFLSDIPKFCQRIFIPISYDDCYYIYL